MNFMSIKLIGTVNIYNELGLTLRLLAYRYCDRIQKLNLTKAPGWTVKTGHFKLARPACKLALRVTRRYLVPEDGVGAV